MNQDSSTNIMLIDQNIWQLIGLDPTLEEQIEYNEQFENEAWMMLVFEKLKEILGQGDYNDLVTRINSSSLTFSEISELVKDIYQSKKLDLEAAYDECLETVLHSFVEDQINLIEKRVKVIKEQTEREVKLSLIKTLWDLFSTQQWDQMGTIFKKIDGYQLPEGLVLHL